MNRGLLVASLALAVVAVIIAFTQDANYWAIAWIGTRISPRDYRALKSIVASIHLS